MAHFYLQFLHLLVLLFVISECRDTQQVTEMSGPREGNALLPCINSSVINSTSCYRVKWTKQMKVIFAWPSTLKFQDASRVKWEADGNGQMSLSITKLQKSDEGLYSCEIWKGWDCILVKNIFIKVKDCTSLGAVEAAPNTTAILSCPVDITSGQRRPSNISWARANGGKPVPLSSNRAEINKTSLTIQSVNVNDSGWYRCKDMLGQSERCFDINLKVQGQDVVMATTVPVIATKTVQVTTTELAVESMEEERGEAFIAVVASVITVIAIIAAALIGLFMYRRCNTQRPRADAPMESCDTYEVVNVNLSKDHTNLRVNSLYQDLEDESMRSFNY